MDDGRVHGLSRSRVGKIKEGDAAHIRFHTHPHCACLAATSKPHPNSMVPPQNTCRYKYSPPALVTSAPAMGFPVKAATAMMQKLVPVRTPISLTSEICTTSAGAMETKVPDVKP